MPRSDFDTEAFLAQMSQAAELTPEDREAAEKLFSRDGVRNYIADHVLRKEDYSRNSQRLLEERRAMDARNKAIDDWYEQQSLIVRRNQEEMEKMQQRMRQYEPGSQEGSSPEQHAYGDPNQWISKRQYEDEVTKLNKRMRDTEQEGLTLIAQSSSLAAKHYHEFHEPLDQEDLFQRAFEWKVPLKEAYSRLVADRRQEAQDAELKARLAEAEEKGRRSALSGLRLPATPGPMEMHPLEARASLGDKAQIPAWKRGVEAYMNGDLGEKSSK